MREGIRKVFNPDEITKTMQEKMRLTKF